jgi:small subunit ribosomal protein S20
VANHPSAEKRNRQRIKRTARNRGVKSAVRTQIKDVRAAIQANDPQAAKAALRQATVAIDKAASKGVWAKRAASRQVSRLAQQVHRLTFGGSAAAPPKGPPAGRGGRSEGNP